MATVTRIALYGSTAVVDAYRSTAKDVMYYSGGNVGNFAFSNALYQHLKSRPDVVPWHVSPDLVNERYDIVIFACANQLGPHTDLGGLAQLLEKVKIPIIAIGLGAQAVTSKTQVQLRPGTRRWVEVLADHAPSKQPNLGIRGEFSLNVLESIGLGAKCSIIGCPSNLTNPALDLPSQVAQKMEEQIHRVAVPAGLQNWPALAAIEQSLASIVTETGGIYIAQSEIDMVRLSRDEATDIDPIILENLRSYIAPKKTKAEFLAWARRYADHYIDAPSWMHAMRKFDFAVGARFHGVMLALQAGVPGGVITHDSRTMEMCQTMGLAARHYTEMPPHFTSADLKTLFPFDAMAYAAKRRELAQAYTELLRAGNVAYDGRLDAVAKQTT
jgi:polysaccharide pyruvyl transferase WcaK-like protein